VTVLRVAQFGGENRAANPKLLPEGLGTVSTNQKPGRGDLRPWKSPSTVATIPAGRATIYRLGRDLTDDTRYWHSWTTTVHAVRGFDLDDTTERTYYSDGTAPKVINNLTLDGTDPQDNPAAPKTLGVPAPASAPSVTGSNGSATTTESYFYVYTYVNTRGEESAPSPVSSMVTRTIDGSTSITGFSAPPSGTYESITLIRIYRTQSTSTSGADFFFLREIAVGTTTTTDDNRALGETIATTTWLLPPTNLTFLKALWNGMLAGISGNGVRFCEPYVPYAWPVAYEVLPPDSKAVALGVFGQQLLVLTTGRPLLVSGSSPESMDQQLLEVPHACVAPKSVVSMGYGVAWAAADGLVFYGSGGAKLLTAGVMTREDWQAIVPSTIVGSFHEGLYFGSYTVLGTTKAFMIDPQNPQGMHFLSAGYPATYYDDLLDQLYVLNGTSIQKWDAGSAMTYVYRSKTFHQPHAVNFACAEVVADSYPVTFRLYADGALRHTQTVTSQTPFRLPSGFRAHDWQLEVEGTAAVQMVAIASSVEELAAI